MKLRVETLGTFYEMARQGAGLAGDRLAQLTGESTRVSGTRLEFTTAADVRAELSDDDRRSGTVIDLSGGLEGTTLLLFEPEEARTAADLLTERVEGDDLTESAIVEACAIMNNGFVDGWADVLGTEIDISAPRYVDGPDLADAVTADPDGMALVFRSRIALTDADVGFEHYFLPDQASAERLFSAEEGVAYENLSGFDRVAQRGADRVTADLTQMTGMEMDVDVRRVSFVALDAIPEELPNRDLASVAFSFEGVPSGFLLFLYNETSATELVNTTVGGLDVDDLGGLGEDAIKETSNIMASGLLDGWANMLETTIDHSTPAFAWDMGPAVVDPLIVGLSDDQEFAFVFDTRIEAPDDSFDVDVYVIPDEGDLEQALNAVDHERVETAAANADEDLDVTDLTEEDLADVDDIEEVSVE